MRTSFHHQPEAQHPHSPAIYTPAGRLPHLSATSRHPAIHSITSSARVSSFGGTVRPSTLAVRKGEGQVAVNSPERTNVVTSISLEIKFGVSVVPMLAS